MSHSKGLFSGTCPGNFVRYKKPHEGVQQMRCPRCGAVRNKAVSRCLFWCKWIDKGKANHGIQKQVCERCGNTREEASQACWWHHKWHRCRNSPDIHCRVCGEPAEWDEGAA